MADPLAKQANARVFLSAEWQDLVMLNYAVDPSLLAKYVPPGTELDSFDGKIYVSLVGFRFVSTRLFGTLPLPFHEDFVEVNLRFYVRRDHPDGDRRGVVFIREIVAKWAIVQVARFAYGENYVRRGMRHSIVTNGTGVTAEYQWQVGRRWCRLWAEASGEPRQPEDGSLEQFITEHYWGYAAGRKGSCVEYQVSHVPWRVWSSPPARSGFGGDATSVYGRDLAAVLRRPPDSVFIADGSPVIVYSSKRIL
jgi:uncharacterized protein